MTKILILCTGNSCRSIMLEAILNHYGAGKVQAFSAGSKPTGEVHPESLATLARHGIIPKNPHSKSWDAFASTTFDVVITVCDNAAGESCPVFLGAPLKAHWGVPDPAHGTTADFKAVFHTLKKRADALLALPHQNITSPTLAAIGTL
jgi:arsenate reductase